jgi:ribosomal protein S18 acetylase RimI-like enzyme
MPRIQNEYGDFLIWRPGSGGTIEIFELQVNSERRRGRGRALVSQLLKLKISKEVKLVWAITRTENFIAQQFYEGMGFRIVAVLRNFYKDGHHTVDAIMYGRDIPRT